MIYLYDGSFDGVMSGIFDAFSTKEEVALIRGGKAENLSLFDTRWIITDVDKSLRVQRGLEKLEPGTSLRMYRAWITEKSGVEDAMLRACRLGFSKKCNPFCLRQEAAVQLLNNLSLKVGREVERMLQFVRFVRVGENLYGADVRTDYPVLPMVGNHFHKRFARQNFFIRDQERLQAIVSTPEHWQVVTLPEAGPPLPRDGEVEQLWRTFFDTVAIPGRLNHRLQQQFVPLKYRTYLTEFQPRD